MTETTMRTSLRTLLTGIIDYAGLFPPAKLDMEPAIRNFARYRGCDDRWMLGRFICPASRLEELYAFAELFEESPAFAFSILGTPAGEDEHWLADLGTQLSATESFVGHFTGRVEVGALELKLPPCWSDSALRDSLPQRIVERMGSATRVPCFVEAAPGPAFAADFAAAARCLADYNRDVGDTAPHFGMKYRSGGVEASAFPPIDALALALLECRDANVPLKFTAGLHHPLRHFNDSVDTKMHGFINVWLAGLLAQVHALNATDTARILSAEGSAAFVFDDESARFEDWAIDTAQIRDLRETALLSFGSCSFDEPREDLRALSWM